MSCRAALKGTRRKTSAERKFKLGQRVRLSASGRRLLLPYSKKLKPTTQGKIVAFFGPLGVKVDVEGYANQVVYHIDFWEPARHE